MRHMVPAGSEIPSGTVIAYVGQLGEAAPESDEGEGPKEKEEAHRPEIGMVTRTSSGPRVSPVIRNLAVREGVDLTLVAGTGPGGQMTREDVLGAKRSDDGRSAVRLTREQLGVARRVARSNREIPTIDLTATIRMASVIRKRRRLMEDSSRKVAFDAFFVSAVAEAIRRFPTFAGYADDEHFFPHETIDVCVAVSRTEKLYLPVVRGVEKMSLAEIQMEIERLVEKTRTGQLRPDDLAGGCFTVSNLGMYPIDSFQMIIPPEQSGVLAIGAIEDRPVVEAGQVVAYPACAVVLSVDHRIINGALAAEFVKYLKETLET